MTVISIQSQVVHGHVGNNAAVFPLQACGIEVAAVPTTFLSNHPHYSSLRGGVLDAEFVRDLLRGAGGCETASCPVVQIKAGFWIDGSHVVQCLPEFALEISNAVIRW